MDKKKRNLIIKIVKIELEMFQEVKSLNPSGCQENPNAFKLIREMGHSVLSKETLESYYKDLKIARSENRNLMTEKYAKMTYISLKLNDNDCINDIVEIESEWMKQLSEEYSRIISHREKYFKSYLTSELETYSQKTLELYYKDILDAKKKDINLVRLRYEYLMKSLGYNSLKEAEQSKA